MPDRDYGAEWDLRQIGVNAFVHTCRDRLGEIMFWENDELATWLRSVWDRKKK